MSRCFQVHPFDNVATLLDDALPGIVQCLGSTNVTGELKAIENIQCGHKIALAEIASGQAIIKFGARIGYAKQPISRGAWVHLHNLASDLDERSSTLDLHSGAPTDTLSAYV